MIDETSLDEMDLPLTNPNEDLEIISENKFKPLFESSKFEFSAKEIRDKGIDMVLEIKKSGKHTGFRFVIQLKATKSIKANNDGTYSLQLHTSNINYLLNSSAPAYYVLYCVETDTFYYESVIGFVKILIAKDADWSGQQSHTLRFSKLLATTGVNEMYEAALRNGLLQRNIKEKDIAISVSLSPSDKIIIDADLNVTDDSEIRKMIEVVGFELVNQGRWNDVIFLHKKATGNIGTSSLYNLVLGVASYYAGNRWEAIVFFKAANSRKAELTEEQGKLLLHFDTTAKYSLGIIQKELYDEKMQYLESSDAVGLYVKLEKAKHKYIESLDINSVECYEQFVREVEEIIHHPKSNENIRLNAKCELVLFEGHKNNIDYVQGVCAINALDEQFGLNPAFRAEKAIHFIGANKKWFSNVQNLQNKAKDSKNYFAFFVAIANEVKCLYEFTVYSAMISVVKEIPGTNPPSMPDVNSVFDKLFEKIISAINYFKSIGHIENTIATLSTKYEMLHYLDKVKESKEVMMELEELIESYELSEHKKRLIFLKNSGTVHEKFKELMDRSISSVSAVKRDMEEKIAELKQMDQKERHIKKGNIEDCYHIHLFPIGDFQFPKGKKQHVFDILNIVLPQAKQAFNSFFDQGIVPVANVYYPSIEMEGFGEGNIANRTMENWLNLYRVRKAFYEHGFYRMN